MSRSNRRLDSWDEGPPGADSGSGSDPSPERSSRTSKKETNIEDYRFGPERGHCPKESAERERDQSRDRDSKDDRKVHRPRRRSSSTDSRHHSNERSGKSRRSSSSEKVKSKKEKTVKSRRRRKSSSSSSESSSSSSSSKSSGSSSSDESSDSHSSSSCSVSDHNAGSCDKKLSQDTAERLPEGLGGVRSDEKVPIPFKNDGSFLEMFKKMQESKSTDESEVTPSVAAVETAVQPAKKPVLPLIMKRRGGRLLKTGLVKKAKAIEEQRADGVPKDAWSLYMQEVKKYREKSCEEEGKTRPLVK